MRLEVKWRAHSTTFFRKSKQHFYAEKEFHAKAQRKSESTPGASGIQPFALFRSSFAPLRETALF
jgi:hypothetical protein